MISGVMGTGGVGTRTSLIGVAFALSPCGGGGGDGGGGRYVGIGMGGGDFGVGTCLGSGSGKIGTGG